MIKYAIYITKKDDRKNRQYYRQARIVFYTQERRDETSKFNVNVDMEEHYTEATRRAAQEVMQKAVPDSMTFKVINTTGFEPGLQVRVHADKPSSIVGEDWLEKHAEAVAKAAVIALDAHYDERLRRWTLGRAAQRVAHLGDQLIAEAVAKAKSGIDFDARLKDLHTGLELQAAVEMDRILTAAEAKGVTYEDTGEKEDPGIVASLRGYTEPLVASRTRPKRSPF